MGILTTATFNVDILVLCFWLPAVSFGTGALRLISVDVPSPALLGESVELSCLFDLQSEKLYSVKWYKDDVEFYRYVPNDIPPAQYLPVPGINIDLSRSSQFTVFLTSVDLRSSGIYRCEVSGEAPLFDTQEAQKEMQVFALPSHGPSISGGQARYKMGEAVSLNCTSAKSKPGADLKWFINDEPARSDYEVEFPPVHHSDGLQSSILGLRFAASETSLGSGTVRFRCVATISRLYTMTNEKMTFSIPSTPPDNRATHSQGTRFVLTGAWVLLWRNAMVQFR